MTTESEQLLVFLQTAAQARSLKYAHKAAMVNVLRESSRATLLETWSVLPRWQCDRLWEIARSVR